MHHHGIGVGMSQKMPATSIQQNKGAAEVASHSILTFSQKKEQEWKWYS